MQAQLRHMNPSPNPNPSLNPNPNPITLTLTVQARLRLPTELCCEQAGWGGLAPQWHRRDVLALLLSREVVRVRLGLGLGLGLAS